MSASAGTPRSRASFVIVADDGRPRRIGNVLWAWPSWLALSAPARAEVVVSLGDSYSSGEGSRDASHSTWDSATRSWPSGDGCHRGPKRMACLIGVTETRHFACSGAKIADLASRGQKDRGPDDVPQLARLKSLDARTEVDTVLLTIGSNDMDFSGKIKACYLGHKCLRDLDKLDRDLARLQRKLISAYSQIAAATSADVVVVGYPDIFPARDERFHGCGWLGENPQRGTHQKTGVWHLEDGLDRTLQAGRLTVYFTVTQKGADGMPPRRIKAVRLVFKARRARARRGH